jgi:hypothetical protein
VEEDLRRLIDSCIGCNAGNPLLPEGYAPFCLAHGVDKDRFCHLFARRVALDFVQGELAYRDADTAMNCLVAIMDIDLRGLPFDLYEAFDAGEFDRDTDPAGTVPWQKYTLPRVREVLAAEGLLPGP